MTLNSQLLWYFPGSTFLLHDHIRTFRKKETFALRQVHKLTWSHLYTQAETKLLLMSSILKTSPTLEAYATE